jgi:3-oxoadipate enol-lactonase
VATTAHTLERDGCALHWWDGGPRDAPCLVLTHGVTIDHGTFATQVPLLLRAGFRVVTWDLRGHGRSRPAARPLTFDRAVDDLAALVDATAAERVVVVGQSFGGMIVQAYQRRSPERVAGIVLAGSLPYGIRVMWPMPTVYGWLAPALQRVWPERHLKRMVPPFMSRRDDVRGYVADAIAPLAGADFARSTRAAAVALGRRDPPGVPHAPTLCLLGDGEIGFVARITRAWAERRAHARFAVLDGAGHLVNQEAPEAFSEAVAAFAHALPGPPSVGRTR